MVAATRRSTRTRPSAPPTRLVAGLVLAALACAGQAVRAEEAPREDCQFIYVASPIDSYVYNQVKDDTYSAQYRPGRRIRTLVYHFNPNQRPSSSDDYGVCRDLANYLLGLQDVKTIAYVRKDVTGYTVLPVLACQEIVMAPEAKLGDIR